VKKTDPVAAPIRIEDLVIRADDEPPEQQVALTDESLVLGCLPGGDSVYEDQGHLCSLLPGNQNDRLTSASIDNTVTRE
jgi:hypothetical protein